MLLLADRMRYNCCMNILSLDYGVKNIGLAWCDTAIGAPLPFGVIKAEQGKQQETKSLEKLADLIKQEKIDLLVVGLPIGTDGKENNNSQRVKKFVEQLKKEIKIPVEFVDERFSSRAADRMEGGVSRDEKAAMIILETYLAEKG